MKKTNANTAAGYIRMSTDDQANSPDRQRAEVQRLAQREGLTVTRWYEDHGESGTTTANRPEFQRLLQHASENRFAVVLTYEQSRLSREDVFDAMIYWRILKDAGVRIITCQRGEISFEKLGSLISAIVDQHHSNNESRAIAERSASGKRKQAESGKWSFGPVFGFDREYRDESGAVVQQISFRAKYRKPTKWSIRLIPSAETAAVDAVQFAFAEIVKPGGTMAAIAATLNQRAVKTRFGNNWTTIAIRGLLTNPVYSGRFLVGRTESRRAKFESVNKGKPIEIAVPAIVSRETFQRAQRAVRNRSVNCRVKLNYFLSGVLWCDQCDVSMFGGRLKVPHYRCGQCTTVVASHRIESYVLQVAAERVLADANLNSLRDAALDAEPTLRETEQLAELRAKIQRATENLALANTSDRRAIATMLSKWRDDERKLARREKSALRRRVPRSELLSALEQLSEVRENLHLASADTLRPAIRSVFARISVQRKRFASGFYEWAGECRFTDALQAKRLQINHADIADDHLYRRVHRFLTDLNRPVCYSRIAKEFGQSNDRMMWQTLNRGSRYGLMESLGNGKWRALPKPRAQEQRK